MMCLRAPCIAVFAFLLVGCKSHPNGVPRDPDDEAMFGPVKVRIHETFTQARDWTGDGRIDGVDAVLEVQDAFGDPTRATGTVIFELFDYRRDYPDPRGKRIAGPWTSSIMTREDQAARWSRATRGYSFQLATGSVHGGHAYVLTASFETDGRRLFDRMIVEAPSKEPKRAKPSLIPNFGGSGGRTTQPAKP